MDQEEPDTEMSLRDDDDAQWEELLRSYRVDNPCTAALAPMQGEDDGTIEWEELLKAHQVNNPEDPGVILLANGWRNRRLRFNEDARLPTPAQKRELLRRDGYCCSTPGCPNHLWIEAHHVVFYSRKGKTISANLTNICGSCHRNVHRGHLKISGQAPDQLVFTDRHGRDLRRTHEMSVAGWLDYWLGWSGGPENSNKHRWARSQASRDRSSAEYAPH